MLLGQLVSISTASSLFFLALSSVPPASKQPLRRAPLVLLVPVSLSLLAILLVPYTTPSTLLPTLLLMRLSLAIPFLPLPSPVLSSETLSIPASELHFLSISLSLYLRLLDFYSALLSALAPPFSSSVVSTLSSSVPAVLSALHAHPAQSWVAYDLFWSCAVFGAWTAFEGESGIGPVVVATVQGPLVGSFVVDALKVLTKRERDSETNDGARAAVEGPRRMQESSRATKARDE
jgi:hypothetical protein